MEKENKVFTVKRFLLFFFQKELMRCFLTSKLLQRFNTYLHDSPPDRKMRKQRSPTLETYTFSLRPSRRQPGLKHALFGP